MQPVAFDAKHVRAQATRMRIDIIEMLAAAGSGHPGGSLSAADIVSTLYFGGVLHYDPKDVTNPERDRFILSKGHAAPVQYAALAEAGIIDKKEFLGLRHLGHMLQGHPDASKTPGVEVSTGSLGQGLSISCGLAQALKMAGGEQKVYCLMGDGELQEGEIWEAAMYAAHHKVDNLVAIVDLNRLQIDGRVDDVMSIGEVGMKFYSFGFEVLEVDGHDVDLIHSALTSPTPEGKPKVVICYTQKGRGVSFMSNKAEWHGNAPSADQAKSACEELRNCPDYQAAKLSRFSGISAQQEGSGN